MARAALNTLNQYAQRIPWYVWMGVGAGAALYLTKADRPAGRRRSFPLTTSE
jgi:hypothetical protein